MGVDSLDLVVFMMAVEDEFEVEFTREDQKKMRTLGDVARRLGEAEVFPKAHRISKQGAVSSYAG